jgi:uncharacterized protein YbjT (DUF2867 family)
MILVAGATGILGGEICRRLVAQGKPVKAMVRKVSDPAKVQNLKNLGVELVEADFKDPASLVRACRGVDTVITTVTTTLTHTEGDTIPVVDQKGQLSLVDAALENGVKRFIYMSFSGNINEDCPLTTAKRTVEERLKKSGMTYTILRPPCFMEIWLGPAVGFDYVSGKAQIYGEGKNGLSFISLGDVAQFVLEVLDNPAANNTTLEIGGPEVLSPLEVVQIFEDVQGRKFDVQFIPEEALKAQKAAATDPLSESFSALMLAYAHGDPINMTEVLKTYRIKLTTVKEYARAFPANYRASEYSHYLALLFSLQKYRFPWMLVTPQNATFKAYFYSP